jgi:hypothetical protein
MNAGAATSGVVSKDRLSDVFGGLLVVAFVIGVVMLATDTNLQNDFGAASKYYSHWYGVLALSVISLAVGVLLVVIPRRGGSRPSSARVVRATLLGGLGWTALAIVAMLGVLATYSQVGFSSANQFATYLFGVTAYSGAESYIPWLYDLLLASYLAALVVGVLAVSRMRARAKRSAPAGPGTSST